MPPRKKEGNLVDRTLGKLNIYLQESLYQRKTASKIYLMSLGLLTENKPRIHEFIRYNSLEMSFALNTFLNIKWRCFMTEITPFSVSNISAYTTQRPPTVI